MVQMLREQILLLHAGAAWRGQHMCMHARLQVAALEVGPCIIGTAVPVRVTHMPFGVRVCCALPETTLCNFA